ncbi:hypothetical protein BDZ89DRAFT_1162863 [Hymenopellis radicata]|nr:hypothetical protein BDZ89DRAFT_1162863 [Hymenopellis radicata]
MPSDNSTRAMEPVTSQAHGPTTSTTYNVHLELNGITPGTYNLNITIGPTSMQSTPDVHMEATGNPLMPISPVPSRPMSTPLFMPGSEFAPDATSTPKRRHLGAPYMDPRIEAGMVDLGWSPSRRALSLVRLRKLKERNAQHQPSQGTEQSKAESDIKGDETLVVE